MFRRTFLILLMMSPQLVGTCRRDAHPRVRLTGAGATFPLPLYSEWIASYEQLHPEVRVNYQAIGSGGGIRQLLAGTVDFGASDVPMTDRELAKAGRPVTHVPTAVGAVAVAYNLPSVGPGLRLSPAVLAGIFLGEIGRWDDPRLGALNPDRPLPDEPIRVVHRADGSGTTAVFTTYLARQSERWRARVGAGPSVSWPTGIGAKGNEGVTGQIQGLPGSLGYVELAYAVENQLPVATLESHPGTFVAPSVESMSAAAAAAVGEMPADLRMPVMASANPAAYPLTALTYVLVYRDGPDPERRRALVAFLWWAVHEGQARSAALHYAPLPAALVTRIERVLRSLTAEGTPLLTEAAPVP